MAKYLGEKGFGTTGTLRANRTEKCPLEEAKLMKKKAKGEMDYKYDTSNKLLVVRWNDNSIVTIASNCQSVEPVRKATRYCRVQRKKIQIE